MILSRKFDMKKALQTTIASAVLAGSLGTTTVIADDHNGVDLTMNMGYLTDYIFRGVALSSGSANGSIDLEYNGAYAGVWAVDLDGGIEVDIYGGYIHDFGPFYLGAGYTSYQYTNSDTPVQNEYNLYAGAEMNGVSLDLMYADGEDTFKGRSDIDYDVLEVALGYNGLFASYGTLGDDIDGDYWAVGYGMDLAGFSLTFGVGGAEEGSSTDDVVTDGDTRAFAEVSWGWDIL